MTEWGNRCQVCTGCGRCAPGGKREEQMKVITASFFLPERRETEGNALGKGGGGPEEDALEQPRGELAIADLGTTTIAVEWYDGRGEKRESMYAPTLRECLERM